MQRTPHLHLSRKGREKRNEQQDEILEKPMDSGFRRNDNFIYGQPKKRIFLIIEMKIVFIQIKGA